MARPRDNRQPDLFRPALEQITDMGHPLVRLAGKIDWGFLDPGRARFTRPATGQPPLPVRQVAGLLILKPMHSQKRRSCSVRAGSRTRPQVARKRPGERDSRPNSSTGSTNRPPSATVTRVYTQCLKTPFVTCGGRSDQRDGCDEQRPSNRNGACGSWASAASIWSDSDPPVDLKPEEMAQPVRRVEAPRVGFVY